MIHVVNQLWPKTYIHSFVIFNGKKIEYIIDKNNIKIIDSYKYKNKKLMRKILKEVLFHDPWPEVRDRTEEEYFREWRAHNLMYYIPLKYFKDHCVDCDLSNNESRKRRFVYAILGRL